MSADDASHESRLITYVVPFVGVLLIVVGIPGAVLGGYVVVQNALGLCGTPTIDVTPLADDGDAARPNVTELSLAELSNAERDAVRDAVESPLGEATVDGTFANRETLLEGAIVTVDGQRYYVTIASLDSCLVADPLLFPIGVGAILVGVLGVLTPPIYRKLADIESGWQ